MTDNLFALAISIAMSSLDAGCYKQAIEEFLNAQSFAVTSKQVDILTTSLQS